MITWRDKFKRKGRWNAFACKMHWKVYDQHSSVRNVMHWIGFRCCKLCLFANWICGSKIHTIKSQTDIYCARQEGKKSGNK